MFRPNPGQSAMLFDPDDRPRAPERPVTPAFTRRRRVRAQRNGAWIAGSVLLLLTAEQIAWAERAMWLDDVRVREWMIWFVRLVEIAGEKTVGQKENMGRSPNTFEIRHHRCSRSGKAHRFSRFRMK